MLKTLQYYYYLLKRKFIYSKLKRNLELENKINISSKKKKYYESQLNKLSLTTNKILKL